MSAADKIKNHLVSIGYKLNSHGDRYDLGRIGVIFDDTDIVIYGFSGTPGKAAMEWKNRISLSMPLERIFSCLAAMQG